MGYRQDAIDTIFGQFRTYWLANAPAPVPPITWQDIPYDPPDDCSAWTRASVLHNEADLASIGAQSTRKWRTEGRVWIQIFTRLGDGRSPSDALVEVALGAFRGLSVGTNPCVAFRGAKAQEVGPEGPWFMQTVSFQFMYDENAV